MAHILVVDDSPEMVETEKQLLQDMGDDFCVSMARNYEDALELLETSPFDLVILDLMLPNRSGVEILDHIKQKFKTPVMIYSAYLEYMPHHVLLKKGADQILAKPAPLQVFMNAIKNLIEPRQERTFLTLEGFNLRKIKNQVFKDMIQKTLKLTNQDLEKTSAMLGISESCLKGLIKRLHIAH
ncbi:MAG: response regulator [Candidatus Omnitrophica bacterium]|nr:response regulator [Candidatus Omnitrophota bacterium]